MVRSSSNALLTVVVDDQPFEVRLREESGARWTLRLVLEIHGTGEAPSQWKDYARKRLDDELPAVLADIRRRARLLRDRPAPASFAGGQLVPPPSRPWHPNRRWYHS